jgi:hypothetical protein
MLPTQKRTKKLSAPASETELRAYASACEKLKMEPADTLRKLAEAFADHAERHGEITIPIRFVGGKSKI